MGGPIRAAILLRLRDPIPYSLLQIIDPRICNTRRLQPADVEFERLPRDSETPPHHHLVQLLLVHLEIATSFVVFEEVKERWMTNTDDTAFRFIFIQERRSLVAFSSSFRKRLNCPSMGGSKSWRLAIDSGRFLAVTHITPSIVLRITSFSEFPGLPSVL